MTTEQPEETKTEELSNSDTEVESNNEVCESGFEHIKVNEVAAPTGDLQSTADTKSKDNNENQMDIDS